MAQPETPPVSHNISEAMAAEARGLLAAAALVGHPGERGRARENAIRGFVSSLVPPGFSVGTGFVIDSLGGESRQQDIVIFRRDYHPVFTVGGISYFPAEAVAAVIEVKSTLNSESLRDALINGTSVKALDRSAGGKNYIVVGSAGGPRSHEALDARRHDHQIFSIVVAAEAIGVEALVGLAQRELRDVPRQQWPNMIVVAGHWTLCYEPLGKRPRSDQMTGTALRLLPVWLNDNVEPLVDLAEQLWSFLRVAPLVDVQPSHYVRGSWRSNKRFPLPGAEGHET